MTKREWTQHDIAEAARRSHPAGHPGFFNTLQAQSRAAFGMPLECEVWRWEFPMGPLTVGQVLDFFAEHNQGWTVGWHRTLQGPVAHIRTDDYEAAEAFRARFGGKWLLTDERVKETGRIFSSETYWLGADR